MPEKLREVHLSVCPGGCRGDVCLSVPEDAVGMFVCLSIPRGADGMSVSLSIPRGAEGMSVCVSIPGDSGRSMSVCPFRGGCKEGCLSVRPSGPARSMR